MYATHCYDALAYNSDSLGLCVTDLHGIDTLTGFELPPLTPICRSGVNRKSRYR